MKHNTTCSCQDCLNEAKLKEMSWWVFYEHRGYMQNPKSFESYEEALKFAKEAKSFMMPYIVFGAVTETYGKWKTRTLKGKPTTQQSLDKGDGE